MSLQCCTQTNAPPLCYTLLSCVAVAMKGLSAAKPLFRKCISAYLRCNREGWVKRSCFKILLARCVHGIMTVRVAMVKTFLLFRKAELRSFAKGLWFAMISTGHLCCEIHYHENTVTHSAALEHSDVAQNLFFSDHISCIGGFVHYHSSKNRKAWRLLLECGWRINRNNSSNKKQFQIMSTAVWLLVLVKEREGQRMYTRIQTVST